MLHLLIIEDETPAYQKLTSLLQQTMSGPFTHDWAKTGKQTTKFLHSEQQYDLVFADIQLSDGLSLDVLSRIELHCPIIFCSAYNNYLLDAFRTNGIAYILKPYTSDDLAAAIAKYEKLFTPGPQLLTSLRQVITREKVYKERLVLKHRGGIHLLATKDISLIEAQGDFCRLYRHDGKAFSQSETLSNLQQQLDPKHFYRINRSQLVCLDHLQSIEPYFKNRLIMKVAGYPEQVTTSSATTAGFRVWLEG
ncbi:MAG: LytTR family DNA-binding domain-containing protein [Bacteroidota bacterium]